MKLLQQQWLGFSSSWHLPVKLDGWYYWLVEKGYAPLPKLAGVDIRQLALSPGLDFAMIGAGGLMAVSYTHLRAHETPEHLVCRLLLEKTNPQHITHPYSSSSNTSRHMSSTYEYCTNIHFTR